LRWTWRSVPSRPNCRHVVILMETRKSFAQPSRVLTVGSTLQTVFGASARTHSPRQAIVQCGGHAWIASRVLAGADSLAGRISKQPLGKFCFSHFPYSQARCPLERRQVFGRIYLLLRGTDTLRAQKSRSPRKLLLNGTPHVWGGPDIFLHKLRCHRHR